MQELARSVLIHELARFAGLVEIANTFTAPSGSRSARGVSAFVAVLPRGIAAWGVTLLAVPGSVSRRVSRVSELALGSIAAVTFLIEVSDLVLSARRAGRFWAAPPS